MIKTAREILEMDTYTLQASGKYPLLIFQKNGNIWRVNVTQPDLALAKMESMKLETPYRLVDYKMSTGHMHIQIDGKKFKQHRLLYEIFVGKIPEGMDIDHINEIKDDNRIENLRLLSRGDNIRNRQNKRISHQKPGKKSCPYKGVVWNEDRKKWRVRIIEPSTKKHIGLGQF